MTLDKRIRRLEDTHSGATQGSATIAERRARLVPYLDSARFDGHREAILTALCEHDTLTYTLRLADDPLSPPGWGATIFLSWPTRDSGGAPELVVFTLPAPEEEPDYA